MATSPEKEEKSAKQIADLLFAFLKDLIYNPSESQLDITKLPEEFVNLGKGLVYYGSCVSEATTMARDLSRGELNGSAPSRGNEIAAPLKSLQASLKHLTWQTTQVAKGDYKQHVSFMGEFAASFNTMIEQLGEQRKDLLNEVEKSKKKSEALSQSNKLLEALTEKISQWIVVVGRESSEWLYVNRDADTVLHCKKKEDEIREWLLKQIVNAPQGKSMYVTDLDLTGEGSTQYFSVAVHPLQWYEHDAVAFVFTDVSYEKHQLRKLETVAYYDPLTNVFNRHYGMELLAKWLSANISFVIGFIDLDNLKYVNDKYGHFEGDSYILKVVETLRMFSLEAIICRLGGDEFMLLSSDCGLEDAENKLEELRALLISNPSGGEITSNYSISYGVVEAQAGYEFIASELLGLADEKMYAYKRAHKKHRGQASAPPLEISSALPA